MSAYSVFPLLCAALFLLLGGFIVSRNPRAPAHRALAWSCFATAWWQGSWVVLFSTRDLPSAALIARIGYSGIVLIPTTFFHFFACFTDSRKDRRRAIVAYLLTVGFVGLIWASDALVSGVSRYPWGYYPTAGPLHPLFLILLTVLLARALRLLLKRLRATRKTPQPYNQTKYTLLAILAYSFASVDFLMNYRLADWYPPGFIAILLSFGITAYAIVQYRLLDIHVAVARTVLLTAVYAVVLGIPFGIGHLWREPLGQMFGQWWWLIPVMLSAILATGGPFLFLYLRQRTEGMLLKEQRRYHETLLRASQGMTTIHELPRLLRLTVGVLTKAVGLTHAAVYLQDEETQRYVLRAARGRGQPGDPVVLEPDDPLLHYLTLHKTAVVAEELHLQQVAEPGLRPVEQTLRRIGADLVIPSFVRDHLLGFVVLGAKRSGRIYTDDDLKILMTLANQAALAIENARFYERERSRQAEMAHTAQLASLGTMAGGMSHQLNNRFYVLTVQAGSLRAVLLEEGDPTALDAAALREHWQKILATLQKIEDNAIRGGDIVKTLLNFSKPGPKEFIRLAMPDVLHTALELAQFRAKLDEVTFEQIVAEPLPAVSGNKNQLTEILVNLLANAYDAIKEKEQKLHQGTLTLAAGQDYRGTITLSMAPFSKSGAAWLQLVVHDTGIGITPEHLPGLFVPFFTTKATAEKGTGLGLFIVKRIIESHGGTLAVHSVYGEGTTFTIHLPALDEAA